LSTQTIRRELRSMRRFLMPLSSCESLQTANLSRSILVDPNIQMPNCKIETERKKSSAIAPAIVGLRNICCPPMMIDFIQTSEGPISSKILREFVHTVREHNREPCNGIGNFFKNRDKIILLVPES